MPAMPADILVVLASLALVGLLVAVAAVLGRFSAHALMRGAADASTPVPPRDRPREP